MTCDETRELLSALLDEALDTGERARVEAHLAGCVECRRELDGLRATSALLSRVERARAPMGFVDRVMARVPPAPWYRRLSRALFVPLSVKVPIEAGAMVVVALLGVYLLQTTPELRDAARREMSPESAVPPARNREAEPKGESLSPEREAEPKGHRDSLAGPPPSENQTQRADMDDARKEAQKKVAKPAPPPAHEAPKTEAPAAPSQMSRATEARESTTKPANTDSQGARSAAPAAPSILSAKQQMATPVVSGALTVTDRQRAEQSLTELIKRTSAQELGRREESGALVVDVAVPQAEYAAFTRELTALGSLRIEGQPAEIPPVVRLSVRISQ